MFPVRYDVALVYCFKLVFGLKGQIFNFVLNILYICIVHLCEIIFIVYCLSGILAMNVWRQ